MDAIVQVGNVAALAAFLFLAVEYRHMPLPQLIVMILVFMRVAPRFNAAQTELQQLMMNLPSRLKVQDLLANCEEAREPEVLEGANEVSKSAFVTLWNVSFRYDPGTEAWALKNVSFRIPAGKITALIGPSGGGKSTLADMLMGLIEPERGYIFVGDRLLNEFGAKTWRQHVAYVQQDLFLFPDTLRANILLSKPDATDEEIWEALERSGAADFVRQLSAGLDARVGDGATLLSVGQRQRVSLARALIRKPSLLVLDEATSALDWENQRFVAEAIEKLRGEMTILTIAHRPSMIAFADHVVALENGTMVEEGAFSALRQDPGSHLSRMLAGEAV
jgi:ATP-binding cassette subfamily C protein